MWTPPRFTATDPKCESIWQELAATVLRGCGVLSKAGSDGQAAISKKTTSRSFGQAIKADTVNGLMAWTKSARLAGKGAAR